MKIGVVGCSKFYFQQIRLRRTLECGKIWRCTRFVRLARERFGSGCKRRLAGQQRANTDIQYLAQ